MPVDSISSPTFSPAATALTLSDPQSGEEPRRKSSAGNLALVAVRSPQAGLATLEGTAGSTVAKKRSEKLDLLLANPAFKAALHGTHVWRGTSHGILNRSGSYLNIGLCHETQGEPTSPAWDRVGKILSAASAHVPQYVATDLPPLPDLSQAPTRTKIRAYTKSLMLPMEGLDHEGISRALQTFDDIGRSREHKRVPFTQAFTDVLCYKLVGFVNRYPMEKISPACMARLQKKHAPNLQRGKEIIARMKPVLTSGLRVGSNP
jgi:hypothetical protein